MKKNTVLVLFWYCFGTVLFACGDDPTSQEKFCEKLDNCSNYELFVEYDECVNRMDEVATEETVDCLECMSNLTCIGIEQFIIALDNDDKEFLCGICQSCCN